MVDSVRRLPDPRRLVHRERAVGRAKIGEKLVGKWEAADEPIKGAIFEFLKNGDLKLTIKFGENKIRSLAGKYKALSEDTLEMTVKGPDGKESTEKVKFKLEKESLSITGPDGKTIKFDKAK